MSLSVRQYHPRLQVVVISNATKEVFELNMKLPDGEAIGPHADVLEVKTLKDLAEVAGTFSIRLTGRRDSKGRTWAHLIQPMSYVEIHLRRSWDANPQNTTLVMRGFVDVATTVIGVGADGKPATYCLIEGRDYGKIFLRALWVLFAATGAPSFGAHLNLDLFEIEFSIDTSFQKSPSAFLNNVVRRITGGDAGGNETGIAHLPPGAPQIAVRVGKSLDGLEILNPDQAPFTGSVWNYIHYFANPPLFEMFITDDLTAGDLAASAASGTIRAPGTPSSVGAPQNTTPLPSDNPRGQPTIVWRRSPYKDYRTGTYAAGDVDRDLLFDDGNFQIPLVDVLQSQLSVSDEQAYNYFLVIPAANGWDDATFFSDWAAPEQKGGIAQWRQELTERFGFLPLEVQLSLWFPGTNRATNTETERLQQSSSMRDACKEYSRWLAHAFAENYLMESGTLVVKGNADIRIGRHLTIAETRQEFYIEGVQHVFSVDPLSFHTNVTVTRGRWPIDIVPYDVVQNTGQDLGARTGPNGLPFLQPPPATPPAPGNLPATTPAVAGPCHWTVLPTQGVCTQPYGPTSLEAEPSGHGFLHWHAGVDFGAPCGTPVVAVADGIAASVDIGTNAQQAHGYGNYVIITHPDGSTTLYGHMGTGTLIPNGTAVKAGQQIGQVNTSGNSTGCHLHFEYHVGGTDVDPGPCLNPSFTRAGGCHE